MIGDIKLNNISDMRRKSRFKSNFYATPISRKIEIGSKSSLLKKTTCRDMEKISNIVHAIRCKNEMESEAGRSHYSKISGRNISNNLNKNNDIIS